MCKLLDVICIKSPFPSHPIQHHFTTQNNSSTDTRKKPWPFRGSSISCVSPVAKKKVGPRSHTPSLHTTLPQLTTRTPPKTKKSRSATHPTNKTTSVSPQPDASVLLPRYSTLIPIRRPSHQVFFVERYRLKPSTFLLGLSIICLFVGSVTFFLLFGLHSYHHSYDYDYQQQNTLSGR